MTNGANKPGLFISFEGGDGTGKSTQINRLGALFEQAGREVVVTREPGGSPGADLIRKLFVEGDAGRWSPLSEALLVFASRADHLQRTIKPALARGAVVITDRFADSTMAYQGIAGELGRDHVASLHKIVVGDHDPDMTILLDLPAEEGLRRAGARGGDARFESKGLEYHEAVRAAYLEIAQDNPDRIVVIDASGDPDTVFAQVQEAAEKTGVL